MTNDWCLLREIHDRTDRHGLMSYIQEWKNAAIITIYNGGAKKSDKRNAIKRIEELVFELSGVLFDGTNNERQI